MWQQEICTSPTETKKRRCYHTPVQVPFAHRKVCEEEKHTGTSQEQNLPLTSLSFLLPSCLFLLPLLCSPFFPGPSLLWQLLNYIQGKILIAKHPSSSHFSGSIRFLMWTTVLHWARHHLTKEVFLDRVFSSRDTLQSNFIKCSIFFLWKEEHRKPEVPMSLLLISQRNMYNNRTFFRGRTTFLKFAWVFCKRQFNCTMILSCSRGKHTFCLGTCKQLICRLQVPNHLKLIPR